MDILTLFFIFLGLIIIVPIFVAIFSVQIVIAFIYKYWKGLTAGLIIFLGGYFLYSNYENAEADRKLREYKEYLNKNYPIRPNYAESNIIESHQGNQLNKAIDSIGDFTEMDIKLIQDSIKKEQLEYYKYYQHIHDSIEAKRKMDSIIRAVDIESSNNLQKLIDSVD